MEKGANKYKRYTLKKLSVGVVSVSIGFGLMFGSVEGVSADELIETNSVMEPNNIDSLQSNEEVSDESNIDKLSETVQSESSEQAVATDQSLETKRQEVKTILGQSNIVGEQYTDLVTKISNAQTIDELERILAEIEQTASLEDNQDESKQSETEHDAEEKLKNHSEEKDRELDKITPPSTETSLSKEASVENLVEVDQFNVTSDVKYTLNDVRHLLNSADIARVESGELTVQQIIEKLLNNKVELRETEARHENGVLAAGVEQNNISTDKQYGKSRSRRSLNGVDVESLFRPFTEQNTVRDVYNRIKSMREAKLIAETEFHFLRFEMLRHLRDSIANNKDDSNNQLPENIESKSPKAEQILNMKLSNQATVTVPSSQMFERPYRRIDDQVKKELDYVNEFLENIKTVLLTRFGPNEEGVYFSPDEYYSETTNFGSHKTRKNFHIPDVVSNADGTVTLKMSSESEGGVELKTHYAYSFNISPELNERIKENQLVRGLYRPDRGQQSDENGDKLQNPVSDAAYEINKYLPQNGTFPGYVGYYLSQWSNEGGYNRKKDGFAKIEFTFEANNQLITDSKVSSSILSNSYNYRHRPGTFIASKPFDEAAEKLKTLLNLMTKYKGITSKIEVSQKKINEFNTRLGDASRVLSQQDYDILKTTHSELQEEIKQIQVEFQSLVNEVQYGNLHQKLRTDILSKKTGYESSLRDLYSVNDLNNNNRKDIQDVIVAGQKVQDAKNKKITLLSEISKLTGKPEITQGEYTNLINLYNEFKGAIEEGKRAIADIPASNEIYPLGGSYNTQRNIHETQLPQNDVVLPVAPPREKVNIGNPTQLTNTEKTSVKNKLKETNPGLDLSIVTVGNDGTVSVRWDETNTTTINKDKIIERNINKDRLQEALTIAEKTVNDDYYKNALDETLKREHFAAKVKGGMVINR